MSNREEVIKGLEQFKKDLKPFCGSHADWEKFDAGLVLLKEYKGLDVLREAISKQIHEAAKEFRQ